MDLGNASSSEPAFLSPRRDGFVTPSLPFLRWTGGSGTSPRQCFTNVIGTRWATSDHSLLTHGYIFQLRGFASPVFYTRSVESDVAKLIGSGSCEECGERRPATKVGRFS